MRVFWAIIGVLVLVTGGLFVLGGDSGGGEVAEPGASAGSAALPMRLDRRGGEESDDQQSEVAEAPGEGDGADEQVVVSTADPEIREAESVEAGLAEMGIEIVEAPTQGEGAAAVETPAPELAEQAENADTRDGEQVVLDAIASQAAGGAETGSEDGEEIDSGWLVSESDDAADRAETEAPVADGDTDAGPHAGVGAEVIEDAGAELADSSAEDTNEDSPGDVPAESSGEVADAEGKDAAPTVETADPVAGGGGPLGQIGDAVKQAAVKAPAGPEGTVERREDGSLLVNGSVVVKGAGTEASPYEVPWDLFVSASRSYAPEKGKELLPAWAAELDGKWVRVRGYLLLPVMAVDTKELLVMLNQWDGCCIGVPPSPYDAAEVRLKTSVDQSVGGGGFVNYGTIKGKLDVDPYIVGGWLLGLYVIEGAEVEVGSGTKGT